LRRAFTLIEVLAIILIASVGILAATGVVVYAMYLAAQAQAQSTGMGTAMSIAADPQPLLRPDRASDWDASQWTRGSYDLTSGGAISCECRGYVNGYYVVRSESSAAADVIATGVRSALVTVQVYDRLKGRLLTSYTTRVMRSFIPAVTP